MATDIVSFSFVSTNAYTLQLHIWLKLKDNLDKPELLFPDASLHYLVCILSRQMIETFCHQGRCVGICPHAALKPARGSSGDGPLQPVPCALMLLGNYIASAASNLVNSIQS